MPDVFRSLADCLRSSAEAELPKPLTRAPFDTDVPSESPAETLQALRDARLFRAKLADALDAAVAALLQNIAADVLARELRLAPCDVRAIVERAIALGNAVNVRVRVHADDAFCLEGCGIDVQADATLLPGDAMLSVEGGEIDATLGIRLDAAILSALS